MIDSFIRRNTNAGYHFEQFLPGYSGEAFPWPTPSASKPSKLAQAKPSTGSRPSQPQQSSAAPPGMDLQRIKPLRLSFSSNQWTEQEHQKLLEGLQKFCRDVRRLGVSLPSPMPPHLLSTIPLMSLH